MTSRVEAGRLSHMDLGKTVSAPMGGHVNLTGKLIEAAHHADAVSLTLTLKGGAKFTVPLDPHTLVTITGKETEA